MHIYTSACIDTHTHPHAYTPMHAYHIGPLHLFVYVNSVNGVFFFSAILCVFFAGICLYTHACISHWSTSFMCLCYSVSGLSFFSFFVFFSSYMHIHTCMHITLVSFIYVYVLFCKWDFFFRFFVFFCSFVGNE